MKKKKKAKDYVNRVTENTKGKWKKNSNKCRNKPKTSNKKPTIKKIQTRKEPSAITHTSTTSSHPSISRKGRTTSRTKTTSPKSYKS